MNDISLPIYVNDAHLCVVVLVSLLNVVVGRLRVGGLCVWTGKPLLDRMLWMVSSSFYSSSFKWYVCSLLYRNLAAAYLCWAGWFEVYGMIVSVNVGFLCMEITQFVGVLWIVVSNKFIGTNLYEGRHGLSRWWRANRQSILLIRRDWSHCPRCLRDGDQDGGARSVVCNRNNT